MSGITKTHNLRFQESEALQAVFPSHLCPNVLKASARLAAPWSVIKSELQLSYVWVEPIFNANNKFVLLRFQNLSFMSSFPDVDLLWN